MLLPLLAVVAFAATPQKVAVPVTITIPLTAEDHPICGCAVRTQGRQSPDCADLGRHWPPDFQISENLAKDLGDIFGTPTKSEDGVQQIQVQLPGVQIGGMALDLQSSKPLSTGFPGDPMHQILLLGWVPASGVHTVGAQDTQNLLPRLVAPAIKVKDV